MQALQDLPRCIGLNNAIKSALDPVKRDIHPTSLLLRKDFLILEEEGVNQASAFVEESLRYIRCQLHSYGYVLRALPIASKVLDDVTPSGTLKDWDRAREDLKAWTIRWFAAIDNTHSMDFKLQAAINAIVKIDELYHPILETRKYHLRSKDAPDPHIISYYYNRTRYYWERQPSFFFLLDDRNIYSEEIDIPHQPIQNRTASFLQDIFNFRSYPVHDPGFLLVCHLVFGLILRIGFPYHTGLFVSPAEVFLDLHILFHFIDESGPHVPLRRIAKAIPTLYFAELGSQMLLSRGRSWDILLAVVMAVTTYIIADTHNSFSWTVSHWMKCKVFLFLCVDLFPTLGWFPGLGPEQSKRVSRSRLVVLALWSLILISNFRIYRDLRAANDAVKVYSGCYDAW